MFKQCTRHGKFTVKYHTNDWPDGCPICTAASNKSKHEDKIRELQGIIDDAKNVLNGNVIY